MELGGQKIQLTIVIHLKYENNFYTNRTLDHIPF